MINKVPEVDQTGNCYACFIWINVLQRVCMRVCAAGMQEFDWERR